MTHPHSGAPSAADPTRPSGPTAPGDATRPEDELAAHARRIAADIAARLADPEQVAATATAPDNLVRFPGQPAFGPWAPLALAEGFSGTALLHAELATADPSHRRLAHAHLARAARSLPAGGHPGGLFQGPASLAFAALAARQAPGDYAALLERLDGVIVRRTRELLAAESERLAAGQAGVSMHTYDLISGVTGLARYLLARQPRHDDLVADACRYLVRLAQPITVAGTPLPGWWAPHTPTIGREADFPHGHVNLGLAHGICGPLALLATARTLGVKVTGQDEAIAAIARWVLERQLPGGQWPAIVRPEDLLPGAPPGEPTGRTAWCYGTPGVARALFLAGRCLERADWRGAALDALAEALSDPYGMHDWALCHGWSGLLQVTWRMAHDSGDARLARRLPDLARHILANYAPDAPFGLRHDDPLQARDRAGLLEGAAGAALALHTYACDMPPHTAWDAAFGLV
ncbi:lanthionine synthetase C family protein [Streptantibioticus rubrisoli]|uniref:Lanthionine synthetase C family protein n=1 Tax=Streptantibioticus rubrisoli TaxID=1387313 RepID=A0ABT1PIP7_9ACTN|nr:lanthionine synthetase C family protein [Streptantibioticus rubrisoli]MCQ4045230.1 lanthionine synthetase C family protein [Streptantibioticus rubrisoli]